MNGFTCLALMMVLGQSDTTAAPPSSPAPLLAPAPATDLPLLPPAAAADGQRLPVQDAPSAAPTAPLATPPTSPFATPPLATQSTPPPVHSDGPPENAPVPPSFSPLGEPTTPAPQIAFPPIELGSPPPSISPQTPGDLEASAPTATPPTFPVAPVVWENEGENSSAPLAPAQSNEPVGQTEYQAPIFEDRSLSPASTSPTALRPSDLLNQSMTAGQALIAGRPLSLLEAIEGVADRTHRQEVILTYWQLATKVVQLHWAHDRWQQLGSLRDPLAPEASRELAAQVSAADARWRAADLEVVQLQYRLAEVASLTSTEELPIPMDAPFVGAYRTFFDQLFAGRTAPSNLTQIDQILPQRMALLEARCRAVSDMHAVTGDRLAAYEQGSLPVTSLLESLAQLTTQREALLNDVLRYNTDIATYAVHVASPGVSPERLVSMLIEYVPANEPEIIVGQNTQPLTSPPGHQATTAGLGNIPPSTILPGQSFGPIIGSPTPAVPVQGSSVNGVPATGSVTSNPNEVISPAGHLGQSPFREVTSPSSQETLQPLDEHPNIGQPSATQPSFGQPSATPPTFSPPPAVFSPSTSTPAPPARPLSGSPSERPMRSILVRPS